MCVCLCVSVCVCLFTHGLIYLFCFYAPAHVMPQTVSKHLGDFRCLPTERPEGTRSHNQHWHCPGTVPAVSCLARQNSLYESVFL